MRSAGWARDPGCGGDDGMCSSEDVAERLHAPDRTEN